MKWLYIIAGLLLIGGVGTVTYTKTLGIRNKNPGNIRDTSTDTWNGQVNTNKGFAVFGDMKMGIRAMGKLLMNYYNLYNRITVRQIINRWAPPTENDTGSYVNSVAKYMDVTPDERLLLPAQLPKLVRAIARHENGTAWLMISDNDFNDGLALV